MLPKSSWRKSDGEDARKVRAAVWVLRRRARRRGFVFDVLCKTLFRIADGIEGGTRPRVRL